MGKQQEKNIHTISSFKEVIRDKNYQDIINSWENTKKTGVESTYHITCDPLSSDFYKENSNECSRTFSSSISSDSTEDDISSLPSSLNGPLYQLSDLMDQLPIKRGLSKHYQGKSKTFTSLASVESLEDLVKDNPYKKRMKLCKSLNEGLDVHKFTSPKAIISKKSSYKSSYSSSSVFRRTYDNNFMTNCKLHLVHVHKDF
ncbi:hypothetical protein RND81_07G091900 [Saponaria officinalis]|uniref:Uncharacterized protein n=1 Tax=Saponaria officinalis TaxID=3572 RepID=A0AAW1JPX1_SAPOF